MAPAICSRIYFFVLRGLRRYRQITGKLCLQLVVILLTCLFLTKIQFHGIKREGYEEVTYQTELVMSSRARAGCIKPQHARGYVICDKLPYTEIKCGEAAKKAEESDVNGTDYVVPDVIHYIWFGPEWKISLHYQYLALRSVASLQNPRKIIIHHNTENIVGGGVWKRILKEIPCIELVKRRAPENIFGIEITEDLFRSDVARLQILKQYGGIYLDLDVITLRSLDPLRIYPVSIGRSVINKISNGIIFSEPNSRFIDIWLNSYRTYEPKKPRSLAYWGLNVPYSIYVQSLGSNIAHIEEVSFNRPNPYVDGLDSTLGAHIDVRDNYFLHIHPKAVQETEYDIGLEKWADERLRTLDSVFGQAARIAMFGSADLVYLPGEEYREPWPKKKILPYSDE